MGGSVERVVAIYEREVGTLGSKSKDVWQCQRVGWLIQNIEVWLCKRYGRGKLANLTEVSLCKKDGVGRVG
jgi:hypothetical protein